VSANCAIIDRPVAHSLSFHDQGGHLEPAVLPGHLYESDALLAPVTFLLTVSLGCGCGVTGSSYLFSPAAERVLHTLHYACYMYAGVRRMGGGCASSSLVLL
jgi:hypothetical protein